MTRILGVDPGETTGWCLYDSHTKRAGKHGTFPGFLVPDDLESGKAWPRDDVEDDDEPIRPRAVLERPVAHGPTRPHVVECAYTAGRLFSILNERCALNITELTRLEVRRRLQQATNGVIQVKNDATVWAALKLLHGGESAAKKGGPLYRVTGHCRAALAVAVAWTLPEVKS